MLAVLIAIFPALAPVPTADEIQEAKDVLRTPAATSTGLEEQARARELLRAAGVPEAQIPTPEFSELIVASDLPAPTPENDEIAGFPNDEPAGPPIPMPGPVSFALTAPTPAAATEQGPHVPTDAELQASLHQRVTVTFLGQWTGGGGDRDANESPSNLPADWVQRRTGYLSFVSTTVVGVAGLRWESSGGPKYMDVRYMPRVAIKDFEALEPAGEPDPLPPGVADFNADGTINVSDLLAFLSAFRAAGGEAPATIELPE